jgi:GT2 family glycosyltransferase
MTRTSVSVIVVTWNGRHHLLECLDSLAAQSWRDFEVVLVDNGSTDGSADFVTARYPWVKVVALPENTGFARGNNVGLENAVGEYVVTLNNDTWVDPGWLAALVAAANAHPEAGMVSSRICSYADPEVIDSMGVKMTGDGMSRGAYRNRRFRQLGLSGTIEILLPSACAALYRRSMIEEIGFFDEDFFAYCEDTDLGLRGRHSGWTAVVSTDAVVRHKYSGTGGAFTPTKLYLVERNHYWVALKNLPLSSLLWLPAHTFWRYLMQARILVAGRGTGGQFLASGQRAACVLALLKGQRDALVGVPRVLGKRWRLRNQRKLSAEQLRALLRAHSISVAELLDDAG